VVHLRWMPGTTEVTFEEALGAVIGLRDEGLVQSIGLSNVDEAQLDVGLRATEVATVSNAYSVMDRRDDALVERCTREGIPYLPFFPLGASPVRTGAGVTGADAVSTVAARLGASATQVALAWLLQRSPVLLPIPGTSSVAHLEENVGAATLQLSAEDLALLVAAQ
jgi:aryl-alcohol dehydrogenase-like predicted oxidoreductase